MGIKQEVVHNEKSQNTAKCLQTNCFSVADGACAEPEEQNTEWMGDHRIIDADAIDVVQNIEMVLWEQDIPRQKLDTFMDTEMSVTLNNKGIWLTKVLTSPEEQHLDTSQNIMWHNMAEIQSTSQVC
jgi:hypothetical protein